MTEKMLKLTVIFKVYHASSPKWILAYCGQFFNVRLLLFFKSFRSCEWSTFFNGENDNKYRYQPNKVLTEAKMQKFIHPHI